MKTLNLLASLMFFGVSLHSQNRANVWMLGGKTANNFPKCGVDFSNNDPDTFSLIREMPFFLTNASICDTDGNLLFYTNGIYIANKNHDTLENSMQFNAGFWTDYYHSSGFGMFQGALVLPRPSNSTQYLVFSLSGEFGDFHGKTYAPMHMSCSRIDMALDGGLGGISPDFKNVFLVEDTLVWGRLAACKHANGRDWWLISHKYFSTRYYKFLITPDEILGPYTQDIGSFIDYDIIGMCQFSPDGNKFACINPNDTLDIFNFDRCTGEFSEPVKILLPDSLSTSCSFSPNSRFLYATQFEHLYQLDMWASDIASSLNVIAEYDGWTDPQSSNLPPYFSLNQLGPDGKIYICSWHGTTILHTINAPDSLGMACDFTQHNFHLPISNLVLPNFTNYELGPLEYSPCDTLYLNENSVNFSLQYKMYPNPASEWLNIVYESDQNVLFELFDNSGRKMAAISLFHYFNNRLINVGSIPSGYYSGVVSADGKKIWSEKIVIQH